MKKHKLVKAYVTHLKFTGHILKQHKVAFFYFTFKCFEPFEVFKYVKDPEKNI